MKNGTSSVSMNNKTDSYVIESLCDVFLEVSLWTAFIAFIINLFNIIIILKSKLCSKLSYILVVNLSISDALLDLVMIVYVGTTKVGVYWSFESFYIIGCVFDICSLATLLALTAMSFDLFMLMIHPLKYTLLIDVTGFRALVVYIWLLSIIPYILLDIVVAAYDKWAYASLVDAVVNDNFRSNCINSVCTLLGFIIMLLLYSKIFRDIYSLKKRLRTDNISMKKSAVTISLVVLVYFVCYMPLWLYLLIKRQFATDLSAQSGGFAYGCLGYLLQVLNTLCDPVIYALRISNIRAAYYQSLLKLKGWFMFK